MLQYQQPEAVFRYFSELSAIPHGSGNTGHIQKWILDTAKRLSCKAAADSGAYGYGLRQIAGMHEKYGYGWA